MVACVTVFVLVVLKMLTVAMWLQCFGFSDALTLPSPISYIYACHAIPCLCVFMNVWFGLSDWLTTTTTTTSVSLDIRACEWECEWKTHITYMNKRAHTPYNTTKNHFISSILMCVYIKIVHCLFFRVILTLKKCFFPFLSNLLTIQIGLFILSTVKKVSVACKNKIVNFYLKKITNVKIQTNYLVNCIFDFEFCCVNAAKYKKLSIFICVSLIKVKQNIWFQF